jgi:L-fuconolactonase
MQPARKRMIVDGQVHLWKASTPDRPWVPGAKPQLPEPFTIERLVPMMDEAGVDRVVIVLPVLEGDRLDYAQEAVKRYPGRFAIMGRIALDDPKTAASISDVEKTAWCARCSVEYRWRAGQVAHRWHRGLVLARC